MTPEQLKQMLAIKQRLAGRVARPAPPVYSSDPPADRFVWLLAIMRGATP